MTIKIGDSPSSDLATYIENAIDAAKEYLHRDRPQVGEWDVYVPVEAATRLGFVFGEDGLRRLPRKNRHTKRRRRRLRRKRLWH